jgi:hypothetical protein
VEFCKDAGIIDGYEDGTFHPYRTLTTDQWLKMLLTAIGFDANKFGLTGKDWAVNTAEVALRYDLITADEYALDFDREVAILYAYKALNFQYGTYVAGKNVPLAESVFGLTSKITYDIFAAPTAEVFSSKGKEIASIAIEPDATQPIATTADTAYKIPAGYTVYVDGEKVDSYTAADNKISSTIYLYDSNAYTAEKTPNAGKAAIVITTRVRYLTNSTANVSALKKLNPTYKAETGKDLVVNDVVTFNVGNTQWTTGTKGTAYKNVTVLAANAGTVTSRYEKDNWIVVDKGATRYFNEYVKPVANGTISAATLLTAEKYNFYYDSYGNIAAVLPYSDPLPEKTLIFLIAAYAKTSYDYSDLETVETVETSLAKYIDLTTGEIKTMSFDTLDGETIAELTKDTFQGYYISTPAIKSYYYAVTDAEGNVALTAYDNTYSSAAVAKGNAKVTVDTKTYIADSKTNLNVLTYTGDLEVEGGVVTETGLQNFTTATYNYTNTYVAVVADDDDTVSKDIYVITPKAEPTETYVYAMYLGKYVDDIDLGRGYQFVTSDGATQTYYFDDENPANTNGSDGSLAIENGTIAQYDVVKLTFQNGSFTGIAKLGTPTTGELIYNDAPYYLSITNLKGVAYYANDFGFKTIGAATGTDVTSTVVVRGLDVHGLPQDGSTLNVYTDNGKVVFITK